MPVIFDQLGPARIMPNLDGPIYDQPRADSRAYRRECARSPRPHVSLSVMARPGATHRTTAPSCTPATRDRACRLHREVHRRPAACRNPGLLDDSGLASASRPWSARGPQAPGRQPGHPGARSSSPAASGRPAGLPFTPCAVTLDQLHRKGDGPRAAGTTDGDASAPRQSRKTLSAAIADDLRARRRCIFMQDGQPLVRLERGIARRRQGEGLLPRANIHRSACPLRPWRIPAQRFRTGQSGAVSCGDPGDDRTCMI